MDMRGLSHFIRDVRKATGNRQEEEDRVDEELAKIRAKFIDTGHISTYERKKYVCKLMFISMLGYPIVFGHMESIQLMAEDTPAEKLIGYLAAAVLLNESSELLKLTTHTVYRDLMSGSNLNRSLALTAVANTGGRTFAETMNRGIEGILLDDNADIHIRKKALLTQLHIHRTYPHIVDLTKVVPKAAELLGASQEGVTMCAVTFLNGCITKDTEYLYKGVPGKLIEILACIILERKTDPGYMYYGVPAPWLQSKVLRFLQYFPIPKDAHLRERIVGILRKMIKATDKVLKDAQTQQKQRGTQNRVSAMNSVLIEVVSLFIKWDVGADVIMDCANVIRSFITDKRESNLRYIGLTLLSRLSFVRNPDFDFQLLGRQYRQQIIVSLHDPDVSIRRKSLGMLVAMCNEVNADNIIKQLQSYLPIAVNPEFQLSLVQSIASLTAKYCDDVNTHVDVMLSIIAQAGDLCSQEIAYRAVRLITNNPQVQKRAANTVFRTLRSKKHVPQMMVGVAAFLLGEFGYQIALNAESTPHFQFNLLNGQLDFASEETQSMILATFFKFYSLYDDARVREQIMHTLKRYKSSLDPELQQRASEYVMLLETGSREILEKVLEPMPAFPNYTDSSVEEVKHLCDNHGVSVSNIETGGSGAKQQPSLAASSASEAVAAQLGDFSSLTAPAHPRQAAVRDDQLYDLFTYAPRASIDLRQVHEQSRLRFTSLLLNTDGVLFADDQVEAHVAMTFHQADCRMIVEVRPRQQEAGLVSADVEIVGTDGGLLLQARCLSTKGPIPLGQCLVVEIAGRSLAAFSSPPSIRLAYAVDSKSPEVVRIVSLPVVSARFITPYGTGSSGVDQLYDSVQRTTSPVVRTIAAPKDPSKEAIQKTLRRLGCSSFVNGEGNVVAVGAHTTQPRGKLMYKPVACEVAWTGASMLVTVYTSETSLQMDILNMLELVL